MTIPGSQATFLSSRIEEGLRLVEVEKYTKYYLPSESSNEQLYNWDTDEVLAHQ